MIFVDTTPLVAICDPSDRLHSLALAQLDRLGARGLVVPESVLVEAHFHLAAAHERAVLRGVLRGTPITPWWPATPSDFTQDVEKWLTKYEEHCPDWADGVLVVAASRDRRARVWTHDAEFRTTWRRLDGSRIPMAVQ